MRATIAASLGDIALLLGAVGPTNYLGDPDDLDPVTTFFVLTPNWSDGTSGMEMK